MDVAEQLFVEKGYDHTSASDIIRKANVAHGTFYYYFKSRDDIVRAIIDRYFARYEQYVEQVAANSEINAPRKLLMISEALFDLSRQKMRLGVVNCDEMKISHYRGYSEHIRAKIIPIIQKIVRQGVEEGFFKIEYPDETADMLVMLNQYVHDELKQIRDPVVGNRKIEALMVMMENTLGALPGTFRQQL